MDATPTPEEVVINPEPPALPVTLEWTFNPWTQNWLRPAAGLAICLAVAVLAAQWMGMPGWGLIAFGLLAGMNSVLFLPVRYRLDGQGVTVWFLGAPSQRDWSHYRNAYFHSNLVHLTTMPRPSALDPFRGHSLQFDPSSADGNRAVVKRFVEAHIAAPSA